MKSIPTIIISFIILTAVVLTQFGIRLNAYPPDSNITMASFIYHFSEIDTFDFNKEGFESEMEQFRVELEALKNHKFEFEFDSEEFKKNMEELAEEMRNQQFTFQDFEFDMSKFKEEMRELKEEMKNFKIDFKDLNIEVEKLNGFLKDLKIEMKKDNLIDDYDEEINLELNKNEMKINGEQVSDNFFAKHKKLYKKHFGKDPGENTHFHIN